MIVEQKSNWDKELADLEEFFKNLSIPTSLKPNRGSTINDLPRFIEHHMGVIRAQNGRRVYRPYLDRLIAIKETLKNG